MRDILANPGASGLGDSLVVPPAGFTFYSQPIALNSAGTAECTGNGCGPNAAQIAEFISALDTLDVILMNSVNEWATRVINPSDRQAFSNFWSVKGYVAIHWMTATLGVWPPMDSLHGARFRGQPPEQTGTIRRDSVFEHEDSWRFLNRGALSNGLDTSLFDEWLYFTTSGATIRIQPNLKATLNLVEASIANPGSQAPMGDHPISWYKHLPTGGRFFYTALGHRADVWTGARTFRRQVYNAILWAAKYDSLAPVSIAPGVSNPTTSGNSKISVSGNSFLVSTLHDGPHIVEIRGIDGRQMEIRRGVGRADYSFTGLRAGVYVVNVDAAPGRSSRLVTVP